MDILLFILALAVYLVTRLVALEDFPIYFFTDEAVHSILAESLVENGFRFQEQFLPTYFPLGATYGLNSATVYLNILPTLIFGKSVFVARATAVSITLLGAVAVSLILKDIFKLPYWWAATLLLSITPTWFLHSRTAFENVAVASFFACFLYFYLRYRLISPLNLYPAILFAAFAFYSHGLGQFLIGITAILFFISDLKYHWRQRKVVLGGVILVVILSLPYFRFLLSDASILTESMRIRGSYWANSELTVWQRLLRFGREYIAGLDPNYWFNPQPGRDLIRHIMKGYGHLLLPSLVFLIWGLILGIKHFRSPAHRIVLLALLAAPFGAALAEVTVLRAIWLVIPVIIFSGLGLVGFLLLLERSRLSRTFLSILLFSILSVTNIYMLWDAVHNGPVWYGDYTLYGMQYGARQVFGETIPEILEQDDDIKVIVSPTWANGTDHFVQFFLEPEQRDRVSINSIDAYLFNKLPVDENTRLILTKDEFERAIESEKFTRVAVERSIDYPDGSTGFYVINFEYAENIDEILANEAEARKKLVEDYIYLDGVSVEVKHSLQDMGNIAAIFDGDHYTLLRGLEANPFILEFDLGEPRSVQGLNADFANMDFTMDVFLYTPAGEIVSYSKTWRGLQGDPHIEYTFDHPPSSVNKIRIEILSHTHGENAHIHIRELGFVWR